MPVQIESVWALASPKGGGDLHCCIARGEKADLIIDQSAATQFVPELFVQLFSPAWMGMARTKAAKTAKLERRVGIVCSGGKVKIKELKHSWTACISLLRKLTQI